ncbi:CysB family HTH-type transcriptional regulator [Ideonella sp.]|uniref:CysB family HTH-type transcriptional regulator n=1 Tax=Ideonella sp. TaxID=1929293 RepID=UPI0037BEB156
MNFQQLRSVREAVRQEFNLTEVANVLHTSQPGISRHIREFEQELKLDLFTRQSKRLTGLTTEGKRLLPIVERMLDNAERLRKVGRDFQSEQSGRLGIAATHSQARYSMPHAVYDFRAAHPEVMVHLHQGSPKQVAQLLLDGTVDIGIATEALASYPELSTLACYHWTHMVLVPKGHPLVRLQSPLTLERLAQYPLITYEPGFTGRTNIDKAFAAAGLKPNFTLEAMDADVIKTYVELGLGVGIIAAIAHQPERDQALVALDGRHLFAANITRLAVRRGEALRDIAYEFIRAFAPPLTREVVNEALSLGRDTASEYRIRGTAMERHLTA